MSRPPLRWRLPVDATISDGRFIARVKGMGYYYVRPCHAKGTYVAWKFDGSANPTRVSAPVDTLDAARQWCENDYVKGKR